MCRSEARCDLEGAGGTPTCQLGSLCLPVLMCPALSCRVEGCILMPAAVKAPGLLSMNRPLERQGNKMRRHPGTCWGPDLVLHVHGVPRVCLGVC